MPTLATAALIASAAATPVQRGYAPVNSNGGHIALQVVLSHPEVVHRLILESMMYSRDGSDPRFWESFDHAKLDDMPAELKQAYLAAAPRPQDLPAFFDKSVQRMLHFKGWTREQIQSVRAKTLLLLGDRDVVRVEHAAQMQQLLRDAQLAVLPGTDHMGIVARAAPVAALVEAFLGSADGD
jgi:pimeloyl-ACP methyl ester carboxylesterase